MKLLIVAAALLGAFFLSEALDLRKASFGPARAMAMGVLGPATSAQDCRDKAEAADYRAAYYSPPYCYGCSRQDCEGEDFRGR